MATCLTPIRLSAAILQECMFARVVDTPLVCAVQMLMRCEGVVPLAGEANAVQRAVLYWTFQVSARTTNLRDLPCKDLPTFEDRFWPNIRRDFQSYTINASLSWCGLCGM